MPDFTQEVFLCCNFNEASKGCKKFRRASNFKHASINLHGNRLQRDLPLEELFCRFEILVSEAQKFTFAKC